MRVKTPEFPDFRGCLQFIGLAVASLLAVYANAETRVIGYVPSYKNMSAVVDKTDLTKLTHINISFLNPDADGTLTRDGNPVCMPGAAAGNAKASEIRYLIEKAHKAEVKVLVSVAGGVIPACSGDWAQLLQSASRPQLVNNLLQFISDFNLDGIDIDIEGVLLTAIDESGNYTPFIQELRSSLPAGKLLTAATASYVGGMVPESSLPYFDFITLMSYDTIGPSWGVAGSEHSSFAQAQADVSLWQSRGLPKSKLVLGVPFYGYGYGDYRPDYSFADIITEFGAEATQKDLVGKACAGCSYITYNGIPTIRQKTRLGLAEGSGVMIWEMDHDGSGENSLLAVIAEEINNRK
jgi:chitinase